MIRFSILLLSLMPTLLLGQSKCDDFIKNNTLNDYNAFWIKTNNHFEAVLDIPNAIPKGFKKKEWEACVSQQNSILKQELKKYNNELEPSFLKISDIIEKVKDSTTTERRINAICRRSKTLFGNDFQIEGHIASNDYKVSSLGSPISFCDYIHLIRIMTGVDKDSLNVYKKYTRNIADVKVNICWSNFEVKIFERAEQQDCGKTNTGFIKFPDSFFERKKYRYYRAEVFFIENITFFDKCVNKPIDERINKKMIFNLRYVYSPPKNNQIGSKENYRWEIQPYQIKKNLNRNDKDIYKELKVACNTFEEFKYNRVHPLTYVIPGLGFDALSSNSLFNWNRSKCCPHNLRDARPYWILISGAVIGSYYQAYKENNWSKDYYNLHLNAVTLQDSDMYYDLANRHHENHLIFFYLGTAIFAISDGVVFGIDIHRHNKSLGKKVKMSNNDIGINLNLSPSLQTDLLGNQYSGMSLKVNF